MRLHVLIALGVSSALVLGTTALAQQPAPSTPPAASPAPRPFLRRTMARRSPTSRRRRVAAAAFAEAKKNNWRMAFAIVGPAGELVYFEKMDGTQMASAKIAQGKARTAVMFRRPSKAFADQYAAGNTAFMTFPGEAGGIGRRRSHHRQRQDHRRDRGERRHRAAGRRGRGRRRQRGEVIASALAAQLVRRRVHVFAKRGLTGSRRDII